MANTKETPYGNPRMTVRLNEDYKRRLDDFLKALELKLPGDLLKLILDDKLLMHMILISKGKRSAVDEN